MQEVKVKSVREQAEEEFRDEQEKNLKTQIIAKLRELDKAKQVVACIEAEIEELENDL